MFRYLIALAMFAIPGVAHAEWVEASTEHFIVYADDDPEDVRAFATDLERFDKAMRVLQGLPDQALGPANRVTVFFVKDEREIRELYGNGRSSVAGFYIPRATGSIAFVPLKRIGDRKFGIDSQGILFHEYAHHMMYSNWVNTAFPSWLIEAFAEFHGTAEIEKDGSVKFGAVPLSRAGGLLRDDPVPLERLLNPDPEKQSDDEVEAKYSRGWALLHYLTFDPERSDQLRRYIAAINQGQSLQQAAAIFGDVKQLERDLNRYLRNRRIPALTISADALRVGEVTLRKLHAGEVATMAVRMRSKRGVDRDAAAELVIDARKAAAAWPRDTAAQLVLAEAEYDAGNYQEAEAAADRALAANPQAVDAMIYKGMALMESADDDAEWAEVRRWFIAANKIDNDDPEPLMLFYRSYMSEGRGPNDNAQAALERAFDIAPFDDGLRMNTVFLYLSQDRTADARAALAPLAYRPHGGGSTQAALEMISAIDGGATGTDVLRSESRDNDKRSAEESE